MESRSMHLHLSEQAAELLDKYCTPRGRGQFLSQLIVDYDRSQMDGQGVIEALRRRVAQTSEEAAQAARALKAVEGIGASVSVPQSQDRRKRR